MIRTKLVTVALAVLLVTVGTVAAAPGNAPVDVGADDQYDDHAEQAEENADDEHDADENATDDADENATDDGPANAAENRDDAAADGVANADGQGPPADMPAQVPDHVSQIHDLIQSFLGGDHDGSLGGSVSDATPDGEAESAA